MVERRAKKTAKNPMQELEPYLSPHRMKTHKLVPVRSALLVIDMQRYFLESDSHAYLPDSKGILENVERLVAFYRANSLPVIYTRQALKDGEDPGAMGRWWKDSLRDDDPMSEILPGLEPRDSDIVLRKNRYSAFIGTGLEEMLRSRKISTLVITGVMTHLCCESTARDAFMRDFDVFIVVDGTASETKDLHISSLKTLTDGFAIPITTKEVLACSRKSK